MVGAALDADQWEVRVAVEGGDQLGGRDQGGHAGEVLVEEGGDEGAGGVGLEVFEARGGREEGAGEGPVL